MKQIIKGSCGCEISDAKTRVGKDVYVCSKCGRKCCSKHYYFNVDGNNRAITESNFRNGICSACLKLRSE